jgi:hypothetical protein
MSAPICNDFCTSTVPPVRFSECSPSIITSEIDYIYVARIGNPLTDWTSVSEWNTRIDNTMGSANSIQKWTVIGDKPKSEPSTRTISGGRTYTVTRAHTLNFTIDDLTLENLSAVINFQCGGTFLIWYSIAGGYLFGGNDGIEASLEMGTVHTASRDENSTIQGSWTWKNKHDPQAILNPMA